MIPLFPGLKGKMDMSAVRVPVADGSLTNIVVHLKKEVTVESVNNALRKAAEGRLDGILEYSTEELVSPISWESPLRIIDSLSTKVVMGRTANILIWYDNEYAYASRLSNLRSLWPKKNRHSAAFPSDNSLYRASDDLPDTLCFMRPFCCCNIFPELYHPRVVSCFRKEAVILQEPLRKSFSCKDALMSLRRMHLPLRGSEPLSGCPLCAAPWDTLTRPCVHDAGKRFRQGARGKRGGEYIPSVFRVFLDQFVFGSGKTCRF